MGGMVGLVIELPRAGPARTAEARLLAEVHTRLDAAEAPWRDLEGSATVVMTPYQRFDWAAAYFATAPRARPLIAVLRDPCGRPRLLLPFAVRRERGLRVARIVGERHANFHMPVFASREAAALPPETVRAALVRLGRAHGIDAYAFAHQPRAFADTVNPLAEGGTPSPSDGYGMRLGPDPEETVARLFSGDARRKLRQKEKWLTAAHGPVAHVVAATAEEAEAVIGAYLAQKAVRFAQLRLPNPFAQEADRAFLTAACRPGPARPAALECHALRREADGHVLATFIGAVDARRFSAMLTSFDPDPALARFSPGDLLLHALVRDQAARGRVALDLGVGEAPYKSKICDEVIALVDACVPVSARGRAFAAGMRLRVRLKRRVKRSPRLRALAEGLRRLVHRAG